AGYRTGIIGKWGLGLSDTPGAPWKQGFDFFFGYLNQIRAHNYYPNWLWKNQEKVPLQNEEIITQTTYAAGIGSVSSKRIEYSHDLMAREALGFIERNRNDPFFLYLAFTVPHANNEAVAGRIPGPDVAPTEQERARQGLEVPDLGIYQNKDWPEPQKGLAAMITRMDGDVGRIMAKLIDLKLDEETIVFFTSDNGPHSEGGNDHQFFDSNGALREKKGYLFDGGIRVPMIVRWPGKVKAGTLSDQVWSFMDFMPTAADLAGVEAPGNIDGVSVLPTLQGNAQDLSKRFLYWEFNAKLNGIAARHGKWKAVQYYGRSLELFDMERDMGEQNDVSALYPEVVSRISAYLSTARKSSVFWPEPMSGKPADFSSVEQALTP
ncbi:MAG: sulfatase-like hydrolase/transferase, partial [Opitutales bacterium]|nr:sulfatase-like hydrolase/transferase [Opitutales bacterium]